MPPACPHREVSPAQALGEQGVLLEPRPNWPEAAPLCPGNPGSPAWTPALCTAEPRPAGQPGVRGRAFRQARGRVPGASPGVYVPNGAPGRKVCGGRRTVQPWAPRPGTKQGRGQVRSPSLKVASSACCQQAAGSGQRAADSGQREADILPCPRARRQRPRQLLSPAGGLAGAGGRGRGAGGRQSLPSPGRNTRGKPAHFVNGM